MVVILRLMVVSVVIVVTHMIVVVSQPLLLLLVESLVIALTMVLHEPSLSTLARLGVSNTLLQSLLLPHSKRG